MGLAFIPLYIRYLGMEAYGLIGLFAVLQTALAILDKAKDAVEYQKRTITGARHHGVSGHPLRRNKPEPVTPIGLCGQFLGSRRKRLCGSAGCRWRVGGLRLRVCLHRVVDERQIARHGMCETCPGDQRPIRLRNHLAGRLCRQHRP